MPLHPRLEKLLESLDRSQYKPITETPLNEARKFMLETSLLLGPPESVHRVTDRTIPGPAGEIPIRIYQPASDRPLPIVVYFHGGGWVIGSIDSHDGYCRTVANTAQAILVSVDYRLAPEHPFPAAIDDAYAAVQWVAQHAEEIGGRHGPIGVSGDSAGGNLATVMTLMARDQNGPTIGCQLLIYPITDCDFETPSYRECAEGYFLTRESMQWFWDRYCPPDTDRTQPYLSPLRAKLNNLPPTLIITAEYDPLRDEAEAYADRLKEHDVSVRLIRYDGMIHGFARRFRMLEEARLALDEMVQMIETHLCRG